MATVLRAMDVRSGREGALKNRYASAREFAEEASKRPQPACTSFSDIKRTRSNGPRSCMAQIYLVVRLNPPCSKAMERQCPKA